MKAISGQRFGRWTVIRDDGKVRYTSYWLMICDCGIVKSARADHVRRGLSQSCGCLAVEKAIVRCTTHGLTHHPLYKTWVSMMNRCYNPRDPRFMDYGGRGIVVCERWHDVKNFIMDWSPKRVGHTVDRIDNNGSYLPENCHWATPKEQQNNSRFNVLITWREQTLTIAQWAPILGMLPDTLQARHERGWNIERMMTQPVQPRKEKKP